MFYLQVATTTKNYLSFCFSGNADFLHAFIEFIADQAIKIDTVHNPIFKDDVNALKSLVYGKEIGNSFKVKIIVFFILQIFNF